MLWIILLPILTFANVLCDGVEMKNLFIAEKPLTIQTPKFPADAPKDYSAKWRIRTDRKATILINCLDIKISKNDGCTDGHLIIDNGEGPRKYCGVYKNLILATNGNSVTIEFLMKHSPGRFKCTLRQDKDEEVTLVVGNPSQNIAYKNFRPNWKKSWKFVTDKSNARVSLLCNNFVMGTQQKINDCEREKMIVETDRGLEIFCGSLENITVASGSLRVTLKTGLKPFGSVHCIIQAVIGENMFQYQNMDTEEVDSSENGVISYDGVKSTTCPCGVANKGSRNLINREETGQHEYPWIVSILLNNEHVCSGTILTELHVLTSAQCAVDHHRKLVEVAVGSNNNKAQISRAVGQVIKVKQVIAHYFDEKHNHKHDIAILLLKHKIKFSKVASPICLPSTRLDIHNQYVTVIGWGLDGDGKHAEMLKKAHFRAVDVTSCSFLYSHVFNVKNPNKLCTYSKETDMCVGDLGAPIVWIDPETNRYTQLGIVSYRKMCRGKLPSLSTNVFYYYKWILQVIADTAADSKACNKS